MSPRPEQPEPYLRGAPYPAFGTTTYPRAKPSDHLRLPGDVWAASIVPVGVRLEVIGDAEGVDVAYTTTNGNLGYRGDGAGITFSVWRNGRKIVEEEAVLGDGIVRLSLGAASDDKPATIYLPEGMLPTVLSVTPVNGTIEPAPRQPRWIAYGDAVTQGWIANGPSQAWTAIAARKAGLDLVNMGYAGAARGEIASGEHIAELPADIISIMVGTNCWTRTPHSVGMVEQNMHGLLDVIRDGHPTTPIVVISPIVRPDAEDEPNKLDATLSDIREAIEAVAQERIEEGDPTLALVPGATVISAEHLDDGAHPGDEGHKRISAAVVKVLTASIKSALTLASDVDGEGDGEGDVADGGAGEARTAPATAG